MTHDEVKPTVLLERFCSLVEAESLRVKAAGMDFNAFELLGVARDEVRCHSAMLHDLLSPSGSHGQGDAFLKLFLKQLAQAGRLGGLDGAERTQERWCVDRERTVYDSRLGLTLQSVCLGRIDLLLESPDATIIIENKIDAGDQHGQLMRYGKYARSRSKPFQIIYLTPDGTSPSEESLGKPSTEAVKLSDIQLISYKTDIAQWLEACINACQDKPYLREMLRQYHRVVVTLSDMNRGSHLTMQIADQLESSPSAVKAAIEIGKAADEVKIRIQRQFWDTLLATLGEKLGVTPESARRWDRYSDYVESFRQKARDYGIHIPLVSLGAGLTATLCVLVNRNVYCGVYVYEAECAVIPSAEDAFLKDVPGRLPSGRQVSATACGGWWVPVDSLDFREFGDDCINLVNEEAMARVCGNLARELCAITQALRDLAKTHGLLPFLVEPSNA